MTDKTGQSTTLDQAQDTDADLSQDIEVLAKQHLNNTLIEALKATKPNGKPDWPTRRWACDFIGDRVIPKTKKIEMDHGQGSELLHRLRLLAKQPGAIRLMAQDVLDKLPPVDQQVITHEPPQS